MFFNSKYVLKQSSFLLDRIILWFPVEPVLCMRWYLISHHDVHCLNHHCRDTVCI